jgi:hypothetical protein
VRRPAPTRRAKKWKTTQTHQEPARKSQKSTSTPTTITDH